MKTRLFLVAGSLALLTSCSKDEQPEAMNGNRYHNAESLFTKITEVSGDIDPEYMLKLNCEWNTQTGEVRVLSTSVEEIPFYLPGSLFIQTGGGSYTVECCCNPQGHNLWVKSCDNKFSCGSIIADCPDAGGCAQICAATIYYTPEDGGIHIELPQAAA